MTVAQQIITVAMCVLGTAATRFLPFLIFSEKRPIPKIVQYFSRTLPAAVFGMLVVYCLKDVSVLTGSHGIPELIAIAVTAALHLWKKNMLISVLCGTLCYILLVQLVFVV